MKGKNVFIRTVTMFFTGKVERVTKSWVGVAVGVVVAVVVVVAVGVVVAVAVMADSLLHEPGFLVIAV